MTIVSLTTKIYLLMFQYLKDDARMSRKVSLATNIYKIIPKAWEDQGVTEGVKRVVKMEETIGWVIDLLHRL